MYPNIDVEPSKMSTRGQIVIPQEIRQKLGLSRDALFMVGALDKDTIIMKKLDKSSIAGEFMKLRKEFVKRTGGLSSREIETELNAARKKN